MAYVGRTTQEPETYNFGGLNTKATLVNLRDGEAQDITNFDIDLSGALTTRLGYQIVASVIGPTEFYDHYYTNVGQEIFIFIANHRFYEATSPAGPWIDRTGSMVMTGTTWRGSYVADFYVVGNGVDKPIISILGSNIQTIEDASLIAKPVSASVSNVGAVGTTTYTYIITAVSGRGETTGTITNTTTGNAALTTSNYNQISWSAVTGALSYNIYKFVGASYVLLASTVAFTFSDTGQATVPGTPPISNTAYNTPSDWNINGQPEGFAVLARGRNQHLIAWRKNNIWAAAYGSATDWFKTDDAYAFQIQGGDDNSVKAVVTLYDFTVFFSTTNSFVYQGSTAQDLIQSKILHTGCVSPSSVVPVGDDIYIWSQFGPTTLSRILQGADVQTIPMGIKINPLIYSQTNISKWNLVAGWHDLKNQRVCWAYPSLNATSNDSVLLWSYTIPQADGTKGGWAKYSGWNVFNAVVSPAAQIVYGAMPSGSIVQLHIGLTDNGSYFTSSYKSCWYDLRTWLKKRMMWLDMILDASYSYYLYVNTAWEFNRQGMTQTHNLSNGSTDNYSVETNGDYNEHRLYTQGDGQHFQFVFTCSTPCRIIGFRPDARIKGTR